MDRVKAQQAQIQLQQQHSNPALILDDSTPNLTWLQSEANIAGFDVPIFTEQFIEHSRSRAHELRQLRKEVGELERQNEQASKNVASMRASIASADAEANHLAGQNTELHKSLNMARQTLLNCFKSAAASTGGVRGGVEMENLDEHVFKMNSMLKQHRHAPPSLDDPMHMQALNFYLQVKSIISKVNFNPLFG